MLEFEITIDAGEEQKGPGLLRQGISLDGRKPITSYPVIRKKSSRVGDYEVFRMKNHYAFKNLERRVRENPGLNLLEYQYTLPTGVTYLDYVQNKSTGDIVDYLVTMYPLLDVNGTNLMIDMVNAMHKTNRTPLPEAADILVPSCIIEPTEGLAIYARDTFMFGFGPLGEQQGNAFQRQIAAGFTQSPNLSIPPYSAEFAIAEVTTQSIRDGLPYIADTMLYGGLRFHTRSIEEIEDTLKEVIASRQDDLTPLTELVEPYIKFQMT